MVRPSPENQSNDSLYAQWGVVDAGHVASYFDRSVTKIRDNHGNIATRAENGYFYLPGRSGEKAFYLARGESARSIERRGSVSSKAREKAQEIVKPETQRQVRSVRDSVDQTRTVMGPMKAPNVSSAFPQNVTKVQCSDGQIATRAENGYFYLPGRSGEKAFWPWVPLSNAIAIALSPFAR